MKIKDLDLKYKFVRPLTEMGLRNLAMIVKEIQELESSIDIEKRKIRIAKKQVEKYKLEILKREKELVKLEIEKVKK